MSAKVGAWWPRGARRGGKGEGGSNLWGSRQLDRSSGQFAEPVSLTFTGGFATAAALPGRFLEAFQLIVAKLFKDEVHQNPDTISYATPGGTFTRIDTDIPRRAKEIIEADRGFFFD